VGPMGPTTAFILYHRHILKVSVSPFVTGGMLHPSGHSILHFLEPFLESGPVLTDKMIEGLLWVPWVPQQPSCHIIDMY
jgi:hypothetical protein